MPGIDVLMLGPGDLSVIAGIPYQFDHPLITDAYRSLAAAAKSAGKWWGTVSGNPSTRKCCSRWARSSSVTAAT